MTLQRNLLFSLALICLCLASHAQASNPLLTRIQNADKDSSLNQPGLTPWHLKMTVQLFDDTGARSEQGTVEQWWTAPGIERIDYAFPSYTASIVRTTNSLFRTPGVGSPPYFAEFLRKQVVHPMPTAAELTDGTPDLRKQAFGKVDLDCIMIDQPIKTVPYPPLGLFPTYCLDRGSDTLRLSSDFGMQSTIRNRMGKFQNRTIALDIGINTQHKLIASSHIDKLEGHSEPYPEASVTDGLNDEKSPFARVAGGVMAGQIVKKVQPFYPETARAAHISGTVVMRAIIGIDGHVHSLKLVTVPDPDLAIAAIIAVRQWTYKPYTLNGQPTDVDTTITVNFNFGPAH